MTEIGYAFSSEEFHTRDLVRFAAMAEEAGFTFALISDHYHPWVDAQGQSPFVWVTIGGIAQATSRLRLGTGVTCPIMRIHPAILAQAAATAADLMEGRFFFGVGTGEALNEHIVAKHWPEFDVRLEMLREAVALIRLLWKGGSQSFHGEYFQVENARIYTLPEKLPEIFLAASGEKAAKLAGQIGDGFISTAPKKALVSTFEQSGGGGKPRIGQVTVCWAPTEDEAIDIAFKIWPNAGLSGELTQVLPTPTHHEQACKLVTREKIAEEVICGPDPQKHIEAIQQYVDAGFEQVYVHQVGPEQGGFMKFYQREVLPHFMGTRSSQPDIGAAQESTEARKR
jgi:G6PDH family F420-dependent oxidoreductase